MTVDSTTGEVVELLRALIRNRCVNDGTPGSGGETRSAELLRDHLGTDVELAAPAGLEHRASLVTRLEGTDPDAPTLLLLAHTDVVPVQADQWSADPFAADLVDGEVWGRGAVDMLNQTAAMAIAFRRIAARPRALRGTLIFAAVADEEAGGHHGIAPILASRSEIVMADAVLTEAGGTVTQTATGPKLTVMIGEKGMAHTHITVRGRPGHGSLPLDADNALVTAAEVVRRIDQARPPTVISETWREFVTATVDDPDLRATLLDPERLADTLGDVPATHRAVAHACTHNTFTPTQITGSPKSNVIPGEVKLVVDIRLLPGQTVEDSNAYLDVLLHDLPVELHVPWDAPPTQSPVDTPIWPVLERAVATAHPSGGLVPSVFTGGTDGRYFRGLGIPTYGFGVLSAAMPPHRYWSYFHGHDERIDLESLRLSTAAWEQIALDHLGG